MRCLAWIEFIQVREDLGFFGAALSGSRWYGLLHEEDTDWWLKVWPDYEVSKLPFGVLL